MSLFQSFFGGRQSGRVPAAIIGAGTMGEQLATALKGPLDLGYDPLFFVDRDGTARAANVAGLRVYDADKDEDAIRRRKIQNVILALPELGGTELAKLYHRYASMGCKVHIYETSVNEENGTQRSVVRDFAIEDLLSRRASAEDDALLQSAYSGKRVLITGGAGAVGSVLCHALLQAGPERLVILDVSEKRAYDLYQELLRVYGRDRLPFFVEIGSVRDPKCLDEVFRRHRPHIVIHAAAHRHISLMERCGSEAIKNNVFGTRSAADYAEAYGAERFLLVSTDKAVHPASLLGASMRLAEMLIESRSKSRTSFCAVRFGNILDGSGSVLTLFRRQIENGGPVTVTDRQATRYLVSGEEASRLVLKCALLPEQGKLFVLDLDRPVRIYDLAVNMIRIAGLSPETDVPVQIIGLSPGEKLHEELFADPRHVTDTDDPRIRIEHGYTVDEEEMNVRLALLSDAISNGTDLRSVMRRILPDYEPNYVFSEAP